MSREAEIISLVPKGSPHNLVGERIVMLPSVTLKILSTRLIELETWALKGLNDPFWRLYLPIPGEAFISTQTDDLQTRTRLVPGEAYLIPPRTTINSGNLGPFSKWYAHFTLGPGGDRATPGVFPVQVTANMQATIETLADLTGAPFPWIAAALVAEALQQLPAKVWTGRKVDPRVERAMDFMHASLARKLSVEDVARAAGMSPRNLNHLFQQDLEMSPMRVLLDFRLDKACRLLRHDDASIEQIAEDCGFPNRYYFSRMLKQHRGTSPAAYRRSEV